MMMKSDLRAGLFFAKIEPFRKKKEAINEGNDRDVHGVDNP